MYVDHHSVMATFFVIVSLLLSTLCVSLSDGFDRGGHHHNHQHHKQWHRGGGGSSHHHHKHHHLRQRRHEWSPSQAIHEKEQQRQLKSQISFGLDDGSGGLATSPEWVFLTKNASTVKAHIGSTAVLPCEVKKDSQFGMITWSRLEDKTRPYSVLTIGDQNYVEDKRIFVARPHRGLPNLAWTLRIQRIGPEDAGRYECQATTHPPQSIVTRLKVVEAVAQILGTAEKIIKSGSTLQLHCILKRATEEPLYVFWYHNDRMINYDTDRGIVVTKDDGGSTMTLRNATTNDSGNYTCSPYNIRAASVLVHVLSEGNSAAAVQNEQDKDEAAAASAASSAASSKAAVVVNSKGSRNNNNNNQAPPSAAVHSSGNASAVAQASFLEVVIVVLLWTSRTSLSWELLTS